MEWANRAEVSYLLLIIGPLRVIRNGAWSVSVRTDIKYHCDSLRKFTKFFNRQIFLLGTIIWHDMGKIKALLYLQPCTLFVENSFVQLDFFLFGTIIWHDMGKIKAHLYLQPCTLFVENSFAQLGADIFWVSWKLIWSSKMTLSWRKNGIHYNSFTLPLSLFHFFAVRYQESITRKLQLHNKPMRRHFYRPVYF